MNDTCDHNHEGGGFPSWRFEPVGILGYGFAALGVATNALANFYANVAQDLVAASNHRRAERDHYEAQSRADAELMEWLSQTEPDPGP